MRKNIVLENSAGQVVRTIHGDNARVVAYVNHDTGRVEVTGRLLDLKDVDFDYTILAQAERTGLAQKAVSLGDRGRLRLVREQELYSPLVRLDNDDPEDLKKISRATAIGHGALALILLLLSFVMGRMEAPMPPVVTVFRQDRPTPLKKQTVKVSEKKLKPSPMKARVSDRTVKPKQPVSKVAQSKPVRIKTQVSLEKIGALGALGGMNNGLKGSAGFNINATNASLGTSANAIGKNGAGGIEKAIHGKGLIASAVGTGGVKATGGYGTRGQGGGRPGYGKMSMVGGSGGYFLPLQEEALVEGGLDRDQIAAVIQKHLGEIIYCYEKGLQVTPSLSGRVGVRFNINGAGVVNTAQVENSSLDDAKVEGCVLNKLRAWKFPKPMGGVNVKVSYPFMLRRVG
jgi:hypothetical protein